MYPSVINHRPVEFDIGYRVAFVIKVDFVVTMDQHCTANSGYHAKGLFHSTDTLRKIHLQRYGQHHKPPRFQRSVQATQYHRVKFTAKFRRYHQYGLSMRTTLPLDFHAVRFHCGKHALSCRRADIRRALDRLRDGRRCYADQRRQLLLCHGIAPFHFYYHIMRLVHCQVTKFRDCFWRA